MGFGGFSGMFRKFGSKLQRVEGAPSFAMSSKATVNNSCVSPTEASSSQEVVNNMTKNEKVGRGIEI